MKNEWVLILLALSFILITGCAQQAEPDESISMDKNISGSDPEVQASPSSVYPAPLLDDESEAEMDGSLPNPIPGLGTLCRGEEECIDFCQDNRGRCETYCRENTGNEICKKIFHAENSGMPEEEVINEAQEIERQAQPPVLKNLGINIGPWNRQTGRAGDLIFTENLLWEDQNIRNEWVFIEFGGTGQRKRDPIGSNIEYWFFVPLGTELYAPVDGTVQVVFFEHTQDWGINFYPAQGSEWIVSFEHVVDTRVNDGDRVRAGDIVAEAAPRMDPGIAMVELAVWKGGREGIYKFCPFDFLDDSLKPEYEEKINRLAEDWEDFIDKDVYEQEDWVAPGCLMHNITEVPPNG